MNNSLHPKRDVDPSSMIRNVQAWGGTSSSLGLQAPSTQFGGGCMSCMPIQIERVICQGCVKSPTAHPRELSAYDKGDGVSFLNEVENLRSKARLISDRFTKGLHFAVCRNEDSPTFFPAVSGWQHFFLITEQRKGKIEFSFPCSVVLLRISRCTEHHGILSEEISMDLSESNAFCGSA